MESDHFDNKEWLKDLFDHAHDLIQIVHLDGKMIYVNNSWAKLLEYSQDEIEGKSIYSFVEEADLSNFFQYRNQVINGVTTDKEIVFNLKTKSGKIVSVEGFISVKLKDETPLYTRGIFRDVTLKLQHEAQLHLYNEELKEKEHNLQQLLINAPDAVIVIDQESHITFWNPKAEEIFGWTAAEVMNKTLSSTIIPIQHRQAHKIGMKRFLATGEVRVLNKTIEITALKKTGGEFYISLTISHSFQGGKNVFIAFMRDITEQKHNQMELERKTKELERSNANLEGFAYAASHDLKEPIRKIHIFSDLLKVRLNATLEEEDVRLFERMKNAATRMSALIDDVLTYSGLSSGISFFEDVSLEQKIALVLGDLEMEIQEKGAVIIVGSLPVIKGHKRQIQQIFQNLIGNALKYSRAGVIPEIYISSKIVKGFDTSLNLSVDDQQKQFYLIEVKDNGIGFKQDDAERIFNVFTRLHGTTEYMGTGVGLTIVRKAIENHNGFITAESEPGKGATFKIFLPLEI